MKPVKRTLSTPARLQRVALDCELSAERAANALRHEPLPFVLAGAWAGGGAIVGSDPVRVAGDAEDPFELLDDVPRTSGAVSGAVGGGWFGWLGYRLAARVERVPLHRVRPVELPDFHLAFYDNVLRRDPAGRWWFEALATEARREELEQRLARLRRMLAGERHRTAGERHRTAGERHGKPARGEPAARPAPLAPSPLSLPADAVADHLDAVADCRRRIAAGEIFQANICLRLEAEFGGTGGDLLRTALARVAPPYAAAFDTPYGSIASLSPELFLRRRDRQVVTGPIKGTIVRPPDRDAAAAALTRLTSSPKDAAEHVMIVDLMRSDLGRVCAYGTVSAPRRASGEPHPGLWHLVSHVRGRLRDGVGDAELLRATFPPGSVTGAPKVQSLKVIAALESCGREVYTGAIGFVSPVAGLELSVAIRTLELARGRLWLGAGGGIVADSDPRRELDEALAKATPIAAAVGTTIAIESGGKVETGVAVRPGAPLGHAA
ncbi:MAG: chorismate-binding protein [Solirubrobacteraceae bacterium]